LESLPGAILTIDKWWGALKTLYGWSLNAKNNNEIISLKERIAVSTDLNKLLCFNNYIILPSIVNRPKILTDIKDIKNKAISVKIDGLHKILFFCQTGTYSCSPSLNIIKINNLVSQTSTIIECEYIPSTNQYFGFDIMVYENNDIRNISFKERYDLLCNFVIKNNNENILYKDWYFPGNYHNIYQIINNNKVPIDGLIFQSISNYNSDIYKWKSPENLTLDFYLQLNINGTYEVYVFKFKRLYKMDIKILENITLLEDLHKKIIECKYVPEKNCWEPLKIRYDKLNPNSYEVAQTTIELLKNPVTLNNIINNL
jgi:hypothetical protein